MKVSTVARQMINAAALSVTRNQVSALLVLFAVIMPVAAPVPAWAYNLNLPAQPKERLPNSSSVLSLSENSNSITSHIAHSVSRSLSEGTSGGEEGDDRTTTKETKNEPNETKSGSALKGDISTERKLKSQPRDVGVEADAEETIVAEAEGEPETGTPLLTKPSEQEVPDDESTTKTLQTVPSTESSQQEINDSTYEPENNLGSPPNKTEVDSPNLSVATKIKHRAGVANYSFQVPFASLPGRGIDASVGMVYNSRVWNTSGPDGTGNFEFDVDKNWIAPGFTVGYGKLKSHFWSQMVRDSGGAVKNLNEVVPEGFTDPDGTRHQLECKVWSQIPGTQPGYKYCTEYGTTDGSFVKVLYHGTRFLTSYTTTSMSEYANTYFTLIHADGTKVVYSTPGSQFLGDDFYRDHYPVTIVDANGNRIDIVYKDGKDNIDYIVDTLGRQIKFYYESGSAKKLIAVTVPGLSGGAERQTIRFYYEDNVALNSQGRFVGYTTAPTSIRTLKYVYFPGTQGGYRYDYHPNFGMITKITKLTGMTVSDPTSLTSTGGVTSEGTAAATTEYLYPDDGSQAPLTHAPKFTQRTDDWLGRTDPSPGITYYDAPEPADGADRISKTIVKQTDFDVEYKTISSNTTDWQNGLTKETSVTKLYGPSRQYSTLMMKTVYAWKEGLPDISGRKTPVVDKVEITDDAGQVRANSFDYDAYNNRTIVREHDFAAAGVLGAELRRTETSYETGSDWINNHLLRLPKEVKTMIGTSTIARVVYAYDDYSINPIADTPGVSQYAAPGTNFRGNVTSVTSFANALLGSDPSIATMGYDITGNVTKTVGGGIVTLVEYAASNQYAYVTKVTRGASTQLVSQSEYDPSTGLVVSATDENNRQTRFTYDPVSLRRTRVDLSNGAWSAVDYNDTQYPYSVTSSMSLDGTRSLSTWSYADGAGHSFMTRSQTANGFISADTEFDNLGRSIRSFNPYTVASLNQARPTGVKFSEIQQIDPLGRPLLTKLADDTTIQNTYSGSILTVTDQAGKKRRQVMDALGRIKRVDEPNGDGLLEVAGVPVQPTSYEYDGNNNLTRVTQTQGGITQERLFRYDSMSRLTHEKQVEATATLNDLGSRIGTGASWTTFYKYASNGVLDYSVDARGVKTKMGYDDLNRVKTITYENESGYVTPGVTYTYDEDVANFYNKGRLTKVETTNNDLQGTPYTAHSYNYDSVGQLRNHLQTIGSQSYQMEYGYNLAGQLTSEKYPSGKVVNVSIDNFGVEQAVSDSLRTYVSGVMLDNKGQISQINLGNGTSETFSYNDRLQMTSQNLLRGAEVVQRYDYAYGAVDLANGIVDASKNNGQVTKIESWIGASKQWSQRFAYDELGRIAESREYKQGDNAQLTYKQVFDYDRFGNLYLEAAKNPTTGQQNPLPTNWIEDNQIDKSKNQFLSWTGVTYDDAGQITTDSKWRSAGFAYDANGRVVKTTKANTPDAQTIYDALGNRVATKINNTWQYMIYDAFGKLIAEYGLPSERNGGVQFVQQDNLGSVRTVTNANGFVLARRDHQVFGEEIGAGIGLRNSAQGYAADISTRYGYGATENDSSTGQTHTGFRKLETQAGRFTSPDPYNASMNPSDPQSFNRYAYVGNDPLNFVDPSGLEMCSAEYSFSQCGGGGAFWGGGNFGDRVAQDASIYDGVLQNSREGYNLYLERVSNASQGKGYITAAQLAQAEATFWIWYGAYDLGDEQSANPEFKKNPLEATFHYSELAGSSGGINERGRAFIREMGRWGPVLDKTTKALMIADGIIIAAPIAADILLAGGAETITVHGAEQVAARGMTAAEQALTRTGSQMLQRDGAKVFMKEVAPGKFNILVEGERGIITVLKNISWKSATRLARNYGWFSPL